jgi:uncharacterized protein YbgA (DUF1722 family)/uncharacterized protein YbbK (DUF523 family)
MNIAIKPRVIISKCIEFESCRYNGQIISSNAVKELKSFIEFLPICPEVEIGLGIPRDPIRIIYKDKKKQLIQPNTNRNITDLIHIFAQSYLKDQKDIDGFILKSRSPSCGIKEVKIYSEDSSVSPIGKSSGFFAKQVLEHFPLVAIEDEGRLRNPTIREHFLRRIYMFSRFREVKIQRSIQALIQFHTNNKFLINAYNQAKLRELGRIVAKGNNKSIDVALTNYELLLHQAFLRSPRCTSNINILMHSFGYISDGLSKDEKLYFLSEVEKYRQAQISLSSLIAILKSWIIRFNISYLKQQTYFSPYPEQLIHAENIDSCLTRNYWK